MSKLLLVGLPVALLMPVLARAQSDFDGTWRIDLSKSVMSTKPDVFLLQNTIYQCKSCVPIIKIKADGQDQTVAGNPYYDTISVKVPDDRSIEETREKSRKIVAISRLTVSTDGNGATYELTDTSHTSAEPVVGKGGMVRVGKNKRPAGAHAISGEWRTSKMESMSDNALTFTLKVEDDTLSMTNSILGNPTPQSWMGQTHRTKAIR